MSKKIKPKPTKPKPIKAKSSKAKKDKPPANAKGVAIKIIANNKRARHNFAIEKTIEVGIALKGSEVKSAKDGKIQLVDSFVTVEQGELILHKVHIAEWKQGGPFFNHEVQRKRKLLAHKREIQQLKAATEQKGYTLVPTKFYLKAGLIKLEIGFGKGKTKSDKRHSIKDREIKQQLDREKRQYK